LTQPNNWLGFTYIYVVTPALVTTKPTGYRCAQACSTQAALLDYDQPSSTAEVAGGGGGGGGAENGPGEVAPTCDPCVQDW
jgi:hypothetical protein